MIQAIAATRPAWARATSSRTRSRHRHRLDRRSHLGRSGDHDHHHRGALMRSLTPSLASPWTPAPRHPRRRRRRRRADGLGVPAARHQHRQPPRLPPRPHRLFGWMAIMGSIWWIYGIGMLGRGARWDVVGGRLPPAPPDDVPASTTPEGLDHRPSSRLAEELDRASTRRRPRRIRDDLEATAGGWCSLPESDRARGEAEATVDEPSRAPATFGIEGPADYVSSAPSSAAARRACPTTRAAGPHRTKVMTTFVHSRTPPATPWSRSRRSSSRSPSPARPPPTPEADPTGRSSPW